MMADEPQLTTADESGPTPERDNGRTEYLLKLTSERVNGLENALEKNWIAHLILAATGLALVFHIGSFRDLLSNYFIHGGYDQKVIAAVDLALLLYYFMKLGHLLTLYAEGHGLQKQLLEGYLGEDFKTANAVFRKSTNFYVEAFFSLGWTSDSGASRGQSSQIRPLRIRHIFWPYMLVTTIIVSVAQAAAIFLVAQAYGWASVILFFGCALIVTLYFLFWSSNKKSQPQATIPVVLSVAMVVGWLVTFHLTSQ
jgi:hypothetical protein